MMSYSTHIGLAGETATIPLEGACDFTLLFESKVPRMTLSFRLTPLDLKHFDRILERNQFADFPAISVLIKHGDHVTFDGDVAVELRQDGESAEARPIQILRPSILQ